MSSDEYVVVRMRLADARKFAADAALDSAAIREIGVAAETTGRRMDTANKRGFLMNQTLFTMRRYLYAATLAFTAASAAAIGWGISFNSTIEQNTVSFKHFLGSAALAKAELQFLWNLAAHTPFQFTNLTEATKKFLAFGVGIDKTNELLVVMGDAISGLGLGAEGIDRATLALGQMISAGRVLGGEMRQLQELGLGPGKILQEELGLTPLQVAHIGELNIPADVALDALIKGWRKRFGGLAAEQAKTFQGQLSTLHDNAQSMFGAISFPLFEWMRVKALPRLNKLVIEMQKAAKDGGGMTAAIAVLDKNLGTGNELQRIWKNLSDITKLFGKVLQDVVAPALENVYKGFGGLLPPMLALKGLLILLDKNADLFSKALTVLLTYLILTKTASMALALWDKRLIYYTKVLGVYTKILWLEQKLLWLWTSRTVLATKLYVLWQTRAVVMSARVAAALAALRITLVSMGAAWLIAFGPIGWIILAVIALAAAFITLYLKWEWFRRQVNRGVQWLVSFFRHHWPLLLGIMLGPFGIALGYIIKYYKKIVGWTMWLVDKVKSLFDKLKNFFKKLPGRIGGFFKGIGGHLGVPGLAEGGAVTSPGLSWVGEHGPELLALPTGASVVPLNHASLMGSPIENWGRPAEIHLKIPIYLDGRQISEITARRRLDKEARR